MMVRRGHGEGTRHKRSDGRWEWRITLGGKRRSFYGRTEREAREKKNAAIQRWESGLRGDASLTVGDYLTRWVADVAPERVRANTLRNYHKHLDLHILPHLGRVRLDRLTVPQVNGWLASLVDSGLKPSTVNTVRSTLAVALDAAVAEGLVLRNVARLATARRDEPVQVVTYTADEARTLLAASSEDRDGPLIAVAMGTGLRLGELLALRWDAVDLDARTVRVEATLTWRSGRPRVPVFGPPKTARSRRTVWLTGVAGDALRRQRVQVNEWRLRSGGDWQDYGCVFPTLTGRPQDPANVIQRVQRVMREAGVPVRTFHALRHWYATVLMGEGLNPRLVADLMGHASAATTMDTYTHPGMDAQAQAADVIDRALGS